MHIRFASPCSATRSGIFIVLDHDYHTEIRPHGKGSSVSRRKLCGCRVARCVHIRKPCEQEEAHRASSAAADRNRTQRQLSTERTQHQLDCQTQNELNVNSAAARAKRTQCQLGSQTRNGSSTNSTGNPPSSFPGDPVTHPPQLVFLARRWSRRSVRQHSVKGQPPHTEPCEFSERFVLTAIRINTPRMSQPFMVARSCTTSRHVSSAWGTHLRSRLHAARTVHVPSAQGVHCENCATNNASPSPRRVRGTRQQ